jgi:transcriptional regulator with XRE-family HTH domain
MLTSEQIRGARAMLRIEQRDLAEQSGVSLETIKRIERIPGAVSAYASTVDAIRRALEAAGVEFIPENGGGPGARLRKAGPASTAATASASGTRAGTKTARAQKKRGGNLFGLGPRK